jgi:phospholipid N-methyltransferase
MADLCQKMTSRMNNVKYAIAAVKSFKNVGSMVPSSSFLVKKIIKDIDFDHEIAILELGAGTGVITREVLSRMSDNSVLYSYENNSTFIDSLKNIHDDRLIIKAENVSNLNLLKDDYFDVVISSLPLANMAKGFKNKIYKDIKAKLKDTGVYLQYQYLLFDYNRIGKSFGNCKLEFCLLNMPPAFIYRTKM